MGGTSFMRSSALGEAVLPRPNAAAPAIAAASPPVPAGRRLAAHPRDRRMCGQPPPTGGGRAPPLPPTPPGTGKRGGPAAVTAITGATALTGATPPPPRRPPRTPLDGGAAAAAGAPPLPPRWPGRSRGSIAASNLPYRPFAIRSSGRPAAPRGAVLVPPLPYTARRRRGGCYGIVPTAPAVAATVAAIAAAVVVAATAAAAAVAADSRHSCPLPPHPTQPHPG